MKKTILTITGLLLLYVFISFMFSADPHLHILNLIKVSSTTDEIIKNEVCKNYTIQVRHTDIAYRGIPTGLGTEKVPPRISQFFMLEGYKDDEKVFSTSEMGFREVGTFVKFNYDISKSATNFFVFNKEEFEQMNKEPARYRDSRSLEFYPELLLTEKDVEEFARCFSKDSEGFRSATKQPISSFAYIEYPQVVKNIPKYFNCEDETSVFINDPFVELAKPERKIIGIIGSDGVLYPYMSDDGINEKVQILSNSTNFDRLLSCTNKDGLNLGEYIMNQKPLVLFL